MKQFYPIAFTLLLCSQFSFSQSGTVNCSAFQATYTTIDSRCASTGAITINATGGSGNYSYKILDPEATPLTSTSTITGLPPASYTVYTKDMETGCTVIQNNVVVGGSYSDPRFQLVKTDVSCNSGNDGSVTIANQQNGRNPFTYTIIAPSPSGVGTTNATGSFSGLTPGQYFIQLRDSCGGVQTRSITIQDYSWVITAAPVTKVNCTTVSVSIQLTDNKGNTNLSGSAFSGFQYGMVNGPGDTTWNASYNFSYSKNPLRLVTFVIKDRCGSIKSFNWQNPVASLGASTSITNYACNSFTATVTSPQNLTSPQYTLKQGAATIQTNGTGQFNNIPYGSYCIEMRDACYDTTISNCFNVPKPVPSAGASVTISNYQCNSFTATVTGQTNLYSPQYFLFNSNNTTQLATSSNGIFSGIPYGNYYIRIVSTAPCYDTTITRYIAEAAPKPVVASSPSFINEICSGFDVSMPTPTNLFNPNYCLYNNGVLVGCNSTGSFPGLTYGVNYCIKIISAPPCYDTTINRCFSRTQPIADAAAAVISNRTCTTFTARIPSVTNIPDPKYCLFDIANTPLGCNTTGQFDNLPYGNYYIDIVTTNTSTTCPVTTVRKSVSASLLTPSIATSVTISNKSCTTFTASITGQTNLLSPGYSLYDNSGTRLDTNSTGVFNNIPYGNNYTIYTTNACGERIARIFSQGATAFSFSLLASESCTINATNIKVTIGSGQGPYLAKVLNPVNMVIATQSFSASTYTFMALPPLSGSLQYKVAVTSACNQTDTVWVTPKGSIFSRTRNITSKCPSAQSEYGSGNLSIELTSNIGFFTPYVIKKDGVAASITPVSSTISAATKKYDFIDLQPATYILEYNITTCSQKVYDTVVVTSYRFPDLANSAAYQCDNSNFGVNAVAAGGVSPFTYEIIGSNPTGPSIQSAAQTSSMFAINTGTSYSLVRMRAIDACGNGTLNDVSVLPLGQLTVSANNVDCFSNNLTLTVDTIPNATYTWYRKTSATDSTLITSTQSYNIPYLLPTDTGIYVCKTSVNSGCLMRLSYYDLKGECSLILPVRLSGFSGKLTEGQVLLNWNSSEESHMKEYIVQRNNGDGNFYESIGAVKATNTPGSHSYSFTDMNPKTGRSNYRLRIVAEDGRVTYSNVVTIMNEGVTVSAGPNPVRNTLQINLNSKTATRYDIALVNMQGQVFYQQKTGSTTNGNFTIQRNSVMKPGLYLLKIINLETGDSFTRKLVFE